MKMRPLLVNALLLAALLLACSLWSLNIGHRIGRESGRNKYDPKGGLLAVDGISLGMTFAEVARITGHRPEVHRWGHYSIPGYRLDPRVYFKYLDKAARPETGEEEPPPLEEAVVAGVEGSVLTQDGRLLLNFEGVSERNPSRWSDVTRALGRPVRLGEFYQGENYFIADYSLGEQHLVVFVTEYKPGLGQKGGGKLLELSYLADEVARPTPTPTPTPTRELEGGPEP